MSKNIFFPVAVKDSGDYNPQEDANLFVTWNNPKTGDSYRLLNLEHDSLCAREGIIELKPLKTTKRHENNVGFRLLNDKRHDCFIGIPISFDHKTGAPVWQKVVISNFETYDLSIKAQRQEWIMVKNSPYYTDVINGVEQNLNFDPGVKAKYKAIDKEREADMFARSRKEKRKAEDHAEMLLEDKEQLEEIALMCGYDPKAMSKQRLWAEVVKFAESRPLDYWKIVKSDTRTELAVLKRGILTGVLSDILSEGVCFGEKGVSLGYTEEQCVSYLKEHPQIMASIDALSRKTDKETKTVMASTKLTHSNATELALQKQIAELEAKLAQANSVNVEKISENLIDKLDPEFAELLAEGKRLGIKGVHMIKDKEKLRQKVISNPKASTVFNDLTTN